jgi:L-methionine (R)-S-oxide reductase
MSGPEGRAPEKSYRKLSSSMSGARILRKHGGVAQTPSRIPACLNRVDGPRMVSYLSGMAETHFRPDSGLALAAGSLEAAASLEEIVSVLRRNTREIVGSDGVAVVLRQGDTVFYAAEDAIEPLWRGRRFPLADCISGWCILNGETAIVPDIESDPRLPAMAYRMTSMRSLVMVPIGVPDPVAALGAYWCASVIPDDATVCRLEALAQQAAAALVRIRLLSDAIGSRAPEHPSGP